MVETQSDGDSRGKYLISQALPLHLCFRFTLCSCACSSIIVAPFVQSTSSGTTTPSLEFSTFLISALCTSTSFRLGHNIGGEIRTPERKTRRIKMGSVGYQMPDAAFTHPLISERAIDEPKPLKVIYIGAGVSGICAAIQFPKYIPGLELVVYEKNGGVGGTWFENRSVSRVTTPLRSNIDQISWMCLRHSGTRLSTLI